MPQKRSFWKREYKGLNVHGWIGVAGMVASIAYYILSRIYGWGHFSTETLIGLIAASTYLLMGQLGRVSEMLVRVEEMLVNIRDLAKEIVELLRSRSPSSSR